MVKSATRPQPGAYQESFTFRRPPVPAEVAPARTRHRKGRIRRFLKKCLAVLALFGVLGLIFAWSQGYTKKWSDAAYDKFMALSIDAGLALETIKTAGLQKTTEAGVIEALAVSPGDPLLAMDMAELEERVKGLPWVRDAVISRELPATIKVLVYERQPFARWQIEGQMVLVDDTGTVIRGAKTAEFPDLPFVVGPGAPEAVNALYGLISTTPEIAGRVVAAVRVGHRRWDLEFDNGMRLKLPEQSENYGEVQAWEAFIALAKEKNIMALDVAVCDLRLPDRIVMRLTPEGQAAFENNDQAT